MIISEFYNWDNKQQSQAQSDQCKMQMAFRSARWCCEFLGTAWSNESDANPPEGDTNPPEGNNSWNLLFRSSMITVTNMLMYHGIKAWIISSWTVAHAGIMITVTNTLIYERDLSAEIKPWNAAVYSAQRPRRDYVRPTKPPVLHWVTIARRVARRH